MQIHVASFALLCAFILTTPVQAETSETQVNLVKDGQTKWNVYLPKEAGVVERFAADELKRYIEKMSGAKLSEAKGVGSATIRIGLRTHLKAKGFSAPKMGFDGAPFSST